jgi:methylphosphotriester-DNA--protein-cysteine methyltransferase
MASFTIREYPSAETSEAAYVSADARLLPLRPGPFTTQVNRIEFEQLWLDCVEESGPRLAHIVTRPHRFHTCFLLSDQAVLIDGEPIPRNGLVRYVGEGMCLERTAGPSRWCSISMPAEAMALTGIALADRELPLPERSIVATAPMQAMLRLRQLAMQAAALNQRQSWLLEKPEVARGLEQALVEAIVQGLAGHGCAPAPRTSQSTALVVDRFHRMIEQRPGEALYMPEVCAAIRVPERTLRLSCHKILGMGPGRYLLLRRLHLAHRALARLAPGEASVTEIATRFGFWHFGRFAATYRSVFGQLPSATLSQSRN